MEPNNNKVFLSYGREELDSAKRMYKELKKAGLSVWFDKESLLPGHKWKNEIKKAIRTSRYFLALMSKKSLDRKGFLNKELTEALEILDEYPESDIFLIPVRIDECKPSHLRLSELNRVDMFPLWEEGMRQIYKALNIIEFEKIKIFPEGSHFPLYFVQLKVNDFSRVKKDLVKLIENRSEITEAYALYGHYDFMVTISASGYRNLYDCYSLIANLKGIDKTNTFTAAKLKA